MPESAARQRLREERERAAYERMAIPAATVPMSDAELADIELDLGSIYGYGSDGQRMLVRVVAEAKRVRNALAELHVRFGDPVEEWGVTWDQIAGSDPLDYATEAAARRSAENLREAVLPQPVPGVRVMHRWAGQWRDADA